MSGQERERLTLGCSFLGRLQKHSIKKTTWEESWIFCTVVSRQGMERKCSEGSEAADAETSSGK